MRGRVFEARGSRAMVGKGAIVQRDEIARIVSFVDADYIYRGVKAVLHSGEEVSLVAQYSAAAEDGLGYGRPDVLLDAAWTSTLGAAIAAWAGAAFEDRIVA